MLPEEIIRKVRKIEITSRKMIDDVMTGRFKSHFRGHGVQFSEHRVYLAGDDIRHIDWKASARSREPLIKKYEEERELTVLLIVDLSGSERFGSRGKLKSEMAAEIGGMLAYAASRTGDRAGALLFAGEVEKIIRPAKGQQHVLRMIRDLLVYRPRTRGSNLAGALESAARLMKHSGVVFIISDFLAEDYDIPLRRLSRRHDVIALRTSDTRETTVPKIGTVLMEDPESGQTVYVDTGSFSFQKWLKEFGNQWESQTTHLLRRSQVEELRLFTGEDYVDAMVRFFLRRRKR